MSRPWVQPGDSRPHPMGCACSGCESAIVDDTYDYYATQVIPLGFKSREEFCYPKCRLCDQTMTPVIGCPTHGWLKGVR